MFGVHIPELQLPDDAFRQAFRAAALAPGETYLELGSGHGRGLVIANAEFEAVARGVEYLPDAIERSHELARERGATIDVERDDLMVVDPSDADVVLLHLGAAFHDILAPRLQGTLKPGARVVACGWPMPGWIATDASARFDRGWIYRPSDPGMQARWHDPIDGRTRTMPRGATVTEGVQLQSGTGLLHVGATVSDELAPYLTVSVPANELVRGQSALVTLTWKLPADLEPGTELVGTVQAHHALGDVGEPLRLAAAVT